MKNVLITGGSGFIGSNLSLKLISKGYHVTVLDNLSQQIHGNDFHTTSFLYLSIKDKVHFINGSVTSKDDWMVALKDQHVIVHFAAETGTGQSMYEIGQYVNVNIDGTAIMLDVLANCTHDVKRVIVASSRAIYGEGKYDCPSCGVVYPDARSDEDMKQNIFDCKCPHCRGNIKLLATSENSKIHPTSVYGITKQAQEQLVMTVCPTIGIHPVAFRYQNVYGPGQSLSNPYTGILSIFSTRIKNSNEINIFEDGRESRDFVYIDDVVDATILSIEKEEANGHVFNVGTGIATDVITVAKTLMEKYDIKVPLRISGNYRLGDIRHNFADISLAKQILGFKPKWDFNEGISEFVKWVNGQGIQEDKYELSIKEMREKGLYK
jgi:dTDP-L-rhamnose 4-epimerase